MQAAIHQKYIYYTACRLKTLKT